MQLVEEDHMPAEKRSLAGTVVAVTGASAGIGAAAARLLGEAGANVVLGARRTERLDALVEEIGADRALAVSLEVRDPEQNRAFVQAAVDRFGRIDSIVANAGIGMYGGIEDSSDDDLTRMIEVNFSGTVWSVRAAVPHFRRQGDGGDVVIVSSVAGLRGGADEAVYAGTKFAQVGLAGSLDRELREDGIRVSAICPAGVETEFAIGAGRTEGDPALAAYLRPEDVAFQIVTALEQPRRLRTTLWAQWSMGQGS
ncbi:SDR family oxidoreductase [Motilibacter rhizosphaerae]|uniref:SDR family oxidoreductase n=1 Tax=Motilibacter rhizosphaerae TaxID=598652 RepID=UPI001E3B44A4|nr:SDR family oxidoreductase [Motilibacter rhizosphaerae]